MMNYNETLDYLYELLPMFQRIGGAAYKADLGNTIEIMDALGNPHNKLKAIHVAGSNGKGSTSSMIASVLKEKGLKVGLHTSPHLKDFTERIRVDEELVDKDWVVGFVRRYKDEIERIKPSFFEVAVGMAFKYFEEMRVDIAIVEVGMGGRLDSTNILSPILSIITNIAMDHAQFLGNNLESIAREKAGIIKKETPIIIGQRQAGIDRVFIETAKEAGASICFADEIYSINNLKNKDSGLSFDIYKSNEIFDKDVYSPLGGLYQRHNFITVFAAIEALNNMGYNIDNELIKKGFANIQENFPLIGRWYKIGEDPLIITDTGHNEEGIRYILEQIDRTPHNKLHIVLAMVDDKDIDSMLGLLPKQADYYISKADIPRGLPTNVLSEKCKEHGLRLSSYETIGKALNAAKENANKDDLIFVGGSTFTVAEVV